jgi:hypothetical protein
VTDQIILNTMSLTVYVPSRNLTHPHPQLHPISHRLLPLLGQRLVSEDSLKLLVRNEALDRVFAAVRVDGAFVGGVGVGGWAVEHADGREGQGGLGADEECRGLRTGGGVWTRGDDVVVVVVVVLTDNGASSGVVTSMSAVKDLLVDDRAISITAVSSDAILQAHGRLGTRTRSCAATIAGIAVGHAAG